MAWRRLYPRRRKRNSCRWPLRHLRLWLWRRRRATLSCRWPLRHLRLWLWRRRRATLSCRWALRHLRLWLWRRRRATLSCRLRPLCKAPCESREKGAGVLLADPWLPQAPTPGSCPLRATTVNAFEWAPYSQHSSNVRDLWLKMQEKGRSFPFEQSLTKSDAKWLTNWAPK